MLSRKEIRDLIPGPYENTKRETDRNGRAVPGVKSHVKQSALFGCFIV